MTTIHMTPATVSGKRRKEYGASRSAICDLFRQGHPCLKAADQGVQAFALHAGKTPEASLVQLLTHGNGHAQGLLRRFQQAEFVQGHEPASIDRRIASLLMVIRWAHNQDIITWELESPAFHLRPRPLIRPSDHNFSSLEHALLSGRSMARTARDYAILHILAKQEMSMVVLTGLDVGSYSSGIIEVPINRRLDGPGQSFVLDGPTQLALMFWLDARGRKDGPLFTTSVGSGSRRLGCGDLFRSFSALHRKTGIQAFRAPLDDLPLGRKRGPKTEPWMRSTEDLFA